MGVLFQCKDDICCAGVTEQCRECKEFCDGKLGILVFVNGKPANEKQTLCNKNQSSS